MFEIRSCSRGGSRKNHKLAGLAAKPTRGRRERVPPITSFIFSSCDVSQLVHINVFVLQPVLVDCALTGSPAKGVIYTVFDISDSWLIHTAGHGDRDGCSSSVPGLQQQSPAGCCNTTAIAEAHSQQVAL